MTWVISAMLWNSRSIKLQGRALVLPWPCPVPFDDSQACAGLRIGLPPGGKTELDELD